MTYNYGGYNPLQSRMDSLMQQKAMIDQQLQSLQQMNNVPPININNNMTSPQQPQTNYDGNFKWVDSEEQARQIANNNLPLILFDNNNPMFYMKNMDGTFKKFKFQEVIDVPASTVDPQIEQRMNMMEGKLNDIINVLAGNKGQDNTNTVPNDKASQNGSKQGSKGGTK